MAHACSCRTPLQTGNVLTSTRAWMKWQYILFLNLKFFENYRAHMFIYSYVPFRWVGIFRSYVGLLQLAQQITGEYLTL